jgi:hypothetical protein
MKINSGYWKGWEVNTFGFRPSVGTLDVAAASLSAFRQS